MDIDLEMDLDMDLDMDPSMNEDRDMDTYMDMDTNMDIRLFYKFLLSHNYMCHDIVIITRYLIIAILCYFV
jgi:carotenoid cleavage dioxygenase-like enzyme